MLHFAPGCFQMDIYSKTSSLVIRGPGGLAKRQRPSGGRRLVRGFTLVELLAVIIIIGLIAGLAAPMLFGTMKANRLTGAGEELVNRISLAQQMAVSRNHEIEVRFYRFTDPETPESGDNYRASVIASPDTTTSAGGVSTIISEVAYFKNGVVVPNNSTFAPLFTQPGQADSPDDENVISNAEAVYRAIRFRPDGTSSIVGIPTNQAYLTLVDELDLQAGDSQVPKNFFAIQIDPYTGRCVSHRP